KGQNADGLWLVRPERSDGEQWLQALYNSKQCRHHLFRKTFGEDRPAICEPNRHFPLRQYRRNLSMDEQCAGESKFSQFGRKLGIGMERIEPGFGFHCR